MLLIEKSMTLILKRTLLIVKSMLLIKKRWLWF